MEIGLGCGIGRCFWEVKVDQRVSQYCHHCCGNKVELLDMKEVLWGDRIRSARLVTFLLLFPLQVRVGGQEVKWIDKGTSEAIAILEMETWRYLKYFINQKWARAGFTIWCQKVVRVRTHVYVTSKIP